MFFALVCALVVPFGDLSAQEAGSLPAAGRAAAPPVEIPGVEVRPEAPLEFSRAWLGRMSAVRRRRAELRGAGRLEGMTPAALAEEGAALAGTLRVPVIPVVYADVEPPFPIDTLAGRLFGPGVGDTVSYAGYWREVSSGLLEVTGTVAPWVRLNGMAADYLRPERYGWARFGRVRDFREQALAAADRTMDFGEFDNDGPDGIPNSGDDDGYVDFVAFLYAVGCPDDWRAGSIWPHRGAMEPYVTNDRSANGGRIRVADYIIHPVIDPATCEPLQPGVLAHETGHAFGLPDLYDYDGSSRGIGSWGLMGTGSHSSPHSPAHPSAWIKEQLGWARVEWIRDGKTGLALPPVERDPVVYRYDVPDGRGRYLLLENRQRLGSDSDLPGAGLLVWRIDPERAELRAWNGDERRPAVELLDADGRGDLARGRSADAGDPFPGETGRTDFSLDPSGWFHLRSIRDDADTVTLDVVLERSRPALITTRAVALTTVPDGGPARRMVSVDPAAGTDGAWSVRASEPWLSGTPVVDGDSLFIEADPDGLAPGEHDARLELIHDASGRTAGTVDVRLEIATRGAPSTVAADVPWSWGLAARADGLIQASYGWDPIAIRRRPALYRVDPARPHPVRHTALPADALYSPVATEDGSVYVLAHARGQHYVYRVSRDGRRAEALANLGDSPAYALTALPEGDLLVAHWDGRIRRVYRDGRTASWTRIGAGVYQLAADVDGTVWAATYRGEIVRIGGGERNRRIATGFGDGGLVAITNAPDGGVYAAERGGAGRIVRVRPDGSSTTLTRVPGAAFYGLAVNDGFLFALDLENRTLLRIPITGEPPPSVAGR
ncbi:MAG: M6 family metalloprotease domain-containing protein [Gemmatimonadota bacterium]